MGLFLFSHVRLFDFSVRRLVVEPHESCDEHKVEGDAEVVTSLVCGKQTCLRVLRDRKR